MVNVENPYKLEITAFAAVVAIAVAFAIGVVKALQKTIMLPSGRRERRIKGRRKWKGGEGLLETVRKEITATMSFETLGECSRIAL